MRTLIALSLFLFSCGDSGVVAPSAERRGPPPPAPSPSGSVGGEARCQRAALDEPTVRDFFPAKMGDFCLSASKEVVYGQGARPLGDISNELDGEAEIYHQHKIVRLARVRYDSAGAGTIDVTLSEFEDPFRAHAMFTKRVVGDGDPSDPATAVSTASSGTAALGIGNAYVVKNRYLAEIQLSHDELTPEALDAASKKLLPSFVKELSQKLPDGGEPVALVGSLPEPHRLPMGVRTLPETDQEPVRWAVGYYKEGSSRYRVWIGEAADPKGLEPIFSGLHEEVADGGWEGIASGERQLRVGGRVGVLAAKRGGRIVVIADEPNDRSGKKLSLEEKKNLLRAVKAP